MKDDNLEEDDRKNVLGSSNWAWILLAIGAFLVTVFVVLPLFGSPNQNQGGQTGVGGGTEELVDRRVSLASVPVREVVNEKVFWIGPNDAQRLLLVVDKGAKINNISGIKTGDNITFTAVIKKIPSDEQMKNEWGLTQGNADSFQSEQLYLLAEDIQID